MLPSLRRRVFTACLTASALVLLAAIGFLGAAGLLRPLDDGGAILFMATLLAAASLGTILSFGVTTLAARSTEVSLERVSGWARHLANSPSSGTGMRPPAVERDFASLITAVGQLADGLSAHIEAAEADRQRLGAVIAKMGSGVLILDSRERVELINLTAASLLGTSIPRAEGRRLIDLTRDHELVAIARECLLAARGSTELSTPTVIELVPARKHVQVIANPLGTSAADRRVIILLQDVTRLTETDTIRREFVANVSHELRTPISGLKALAETLEAGALEDPPAARAFLGQISREADRLAQLVEELLELAQLESGKLTLTEEALDLRAVLAEAAGRLDALAQKGGVALEVADHAEQLPVTGDARRLERVFVNLIDNAIRFTPPGGRIRVGFQIDGGRAVATVTDSGPGIPSRDLGRIFERFYKSDRARASDGSGLGLAIAKHTVQAHHGEIWVTSTEGEGATFFVSLPLATP